MGSVSGTKALRVEGEVRALGAVVVGSGFTLNRGVRNGAAGTEGRSGVEGGQVAIWRGGVGGGDKAGMLGGGGDVEGNRVQAVDRHRVHPAVGDVVRVS